MLGTVRVLKPTKGFGFVVDEETKKEYFFHRSEFQGHWNDLVDDYEGGKKIHVEFEEEADTGKGPRACSVQRLDWPN